jgi:hypothetical protein
VLKPIFESDFFPCSYGFRLNHRAHDAAAEVRHFTSHSYEWSVEGDIKACFDEISNSGLLARVRDRVEGKRVLTLVPIDPEDLTSPWQEAGASALAFIVGAVRPLLAIPLPPPAGRGARRLLVSLDRCHTDTHQGISGQFRPRRAGRPHPVR